MPIKRLAKPYLAPCAFCARETILRWNLSMKTKQFDICTICYEEQQEYRQEGKPRA